MVAIENIGDLVTATFNKVVKRNKLVYLPHTLQDFVAFPRLMNQKAEFFDSGPNVQWNIMLNHEDNAEWTEPFASDNTSAADVLTSAQVPWKHIVTSHIYDLREAAVNGAVKSNSAEKLFSIVEARRLSAFAALIEAQETAFFSKPTNQTTDTKPAFGLRVYVVKDITPAAGGFTADLPSNFTTVANLDPSTAANARWRNWAYATGGTVNKETFIARMREAMMRIKFKNPQVVPELKGADQYSHVTNLSIVQDLETELENQNMSLGNDIASKDGKVLFRGAPVEWAPELDNDSDNPIYHLNWGSMQWAFLDGFKNRESENMSGRSHLVKQFFIDSTFNLMCMDRRANAVGSQTANNT